MIHVSHKVLSGLVFKHRLVNQVTQNYLYVESEQKLLDSRESYIDY